MVQRAAPHPRRAGFNPRTSWAYNWVSEGNYGALAQRDQSLISYVNQNFTKNSISWDRIAHKKGEIIQLSILDTLSFRQSKQKRLLKDHTYPSSEASFDANGIHLFLKGKRGSFCAVPSQKYKGINQERKKRWNLRRFVMEKELNCKLRRLYPNSCWSNPSVIAEVLAEGKQLAPNEQLVLLQKKWIRTAEKFFRIGALTISKGSFGEENYNELAPAFSLPGKLGNKEEMKTVAKSSPPNLGIRVQLKGCLRPSQLSQKVWFQGGQVPFGRLTHHIDTGFTSVRRQASSQGINIWVFRGGRLTIRR